MPKPEPPRDPEQQPLFLELFRLTKDNVVLAKEVVVTSATGDVTASLFRPETPEALPAVLVLPGPEGRSEWMKQSARELASIGYVVLVPEPSRRGRQAAKEIRGASAALADETTLADHSASVRWLRRRADVIPDRIGVLGWGQGGDEALALAATTSLQACVACDPRITDDTALLAVLRGTPILVILGEDDTEALNSVQTVRKALPLGHVQVFNRVRAGFMRPGQSAEAHEAAERAYVSLYEFFGKYVEDAQKISLTPALPRTPTSPSRATIGDIMRAVNVPTGVRGTILKMLDEKTNDLRQWNRIRANAALLVEAGMVLQDRRPKKGTASQWAQEARSYTTIAEAVVAAADRRDYAGARESMQELGRSCASCHRHHR